MVRSTSLDPNLGPRADGPHGSLEMLCKPGNDLRLKQRGFTAKTPWIPLHLHRCWSEVALWGWNREASQPKRSRNLSFHLICAGEKWLTFFSCVPHLDSELPVYPAVCSMTACTPGAPGSGRHTFLLLAVVLNLAHNLESPGEGGSAPPQSSIDTPEKLSQNLQAGWSPEGRCRHLMAASWLPKATRLRASPRRERPSDPCVTSLNMVCAKWRNTAFLKCQYTIIN